MLEALGNLGDFVGGIAVVATLIYLAIQVRQNTSQLRDSSTIVRVQARDEAFHSFTEFRSKIICNADVADLYRRGLRDIDALEGTDRLRFHMLMSEYFHLLQAAVYRIQSLGFGDQAVSISELGIDEALRSPGIAEWWRRNHGEFRAEFVAVVDGCLESA